MSAQPRHLAALGSPFAAGPGLGSAHPWVYGFRSAPPGNLASSFHPDASGMLAVADEILRMVRS